MKTQTDIQTLAKEVSSMFETKKRDNGKEFYCLKDGAPQWVTDMVYAAHNDMMPDDHKYDFIVEALDAIADSEDVDDITLEADVYNGDLLRWVGSHLERAGYVEDAVKEFGMDANSFEFFTALSSGQYLEKQEVLNSVRYSLEKEVA